MPLAATAAASGPPAAALPRSGPILDLVPFRAAPLCVDPYPFVITQGCIREDALPALRRDFPKLRQTGFHPVEAFTPEGAFAALLDELEGPDLADAMSEKLGVDLRPLPRLVTIRRVSAAHEGRPHTDGASKVATFLLYLHQGWSSPEGRLRILRSPDLADWVAEISPEEGNALGFLRSEHSWHGHTPYVGERRVVQLAWLRDAESIARKKRRHGVSRFFKTALGWMGL